MAYWWVSQNQTFRQERQGGYLWAPDENDGGWTPFHWANLNLVQPGDLIFSYVNMKIVAVSVAKASAMSRKRPPDIGEGVWEDDGKLIEVEYRDLPEPVALSDVLSELQPLLPDRYSPLTRFGTGNQGYLFSLPPRAGRLLLERIDGISPMTVEEGIERAVPGSTERRALILSRVGQGQFREDLMRVWNGRCAVTGLDLAPLLRASHIKPWRDSDNGERLDPYNGLLLSPSYDAAFDSGLISFAENGEPILTSELTPSRVEQLGISSTARISGLQEGHRGYLDFHRKNVYRG
jgi:hypothetical protein